MSSRHWNSTPRHGAVVARSRTPAPLILHGNDVSCRVQHWSFQPQTAQLVLYHQQGLPTLRDLSHWTDRLTELGYTRVRTTALAAPAALRVESAGFRSIQELVLLEHTDPRHPRRSDTVATTPVTPTQRMVAAQHAAASDIDVAAFTEDWSLETQAIGDVCAATPRFRARSAGEPMSAYAITGRDANQGFLQRLAVQPEHQRAGLGRALVLDSLRWLGRWRVQRVLVNTPVDNFPALALYERMGFRRMSDRLRVYELVVQ
ncbi:MAG TPA: GNAT family N-acetyltransferase [Ilumatobacteraceae bacterium]|nr:GNAT family N-acetyltransferase [Ilumatobacteraceae bacterium]HRB02352.1 GNAT family N-acetyltransferase [Ilumatobacteraceae bacterium]